MTTVKLIQFCPSLQLLQRFFQNVALKGTSHRDEWLSLFQFYRKTFLPLDPKQAKNVKFLLSSIIETPPKEGA
jgi:hypothetical protein